MIQTFLPRRYLTIGALSLLLALTGVACDGAGPETPAAAPSIAQSQPSASAPAPSTAASASPKACAAAEKVVALDEEVQQVLRGELQKIFQNLQEASPAERDRLFARFIQGASKVLKERLPELEAAYEDLAAAVPSELGQDVDTLASFTIESIAKFEKIRSLPDLQRLLSELGASGGQGAIEASRRIDAFTQSGCGIRFAD